VNKKEQNKNVGKSHPKQLATSHSSKTWPSFLTFYIEEISTGSASKHVQAVCK